MKLFKRFAPFSLRMLSRERPKPAHLALGESGEDAAAAHLKAAGFAILERNWRSGPLEIDIICLDGDTIVFAEVKTRRKPGYGGPLAALTSAKKRRLVKCALVWIRRNDAWERPARFDVLCITGEGKNARLEHYRNAFEFSPSLDSRNAPWQPW